MGQALYRKYRSKSLSEVVGQDHITQSLSNALKSGKISHAYLFTGPRGVGKTSVARILAHEINGIPYTDDSGHIDIIEIDAASNRRIDEIRELRETVYVAPSSAKYKVYIIDEVHMLTREAFNALLKTLEEPPAHVVFILATTDAHKLPDTIVSRTQRYNFKPVDRAAVAKHLKVIAKNENIKISDDALDLLAEHGEGSFRDSISLLDQASNQTSDISSDNIRQLLGLPPSNILEELIQASQGSNAVNLIDVLQSLYDQGYQASTIAKQIGKLLRSNYLEFGDENDLILMSDLLAVPSANDPERYLEIVLLKHQPKTTVNASSDNKQLREDLADPKLSSQNIHDITESTKEKPASKVSGTKGVKVNEIKTALITNDDELWPSLLQSLKGKHNTLYGVVRMAEPKYEDGTLNLAFAFPFHQKKLNEAGNKKLLSDALHELTGKNVEIICVVDSNAQPPKIEVVSEHVNEPQPKKEDDLSAISNIFGGVELLES